VQTIQELMDEVAKLSSQVQSQVSRMVSSLDEQSREAQSLRSTSEANLQLADRLQDTAATLVTDADQARRNADDGGTVVGTAIANTEALAASISQADELVRALQSRSQSISAIVDKIKGLAFQTNILALNATIEAAHAGAQGKGFAVVADNVRRLAGEAGDAASDIGREIGFILEHVQQTAQLLDSSQALADEGRGSAAMARDALQAIHASVCSVHAAMAHLQEVSAQQAEQNRSLQHVAGRIEEGIQQVAQGSGSINDAMGRLHARLHAH
jgi:methyl-accepting chemotaxis protein